MMKRYATLILLCIIGMAHAVDVELGKKINGAELHAWTAHKTKAMKSAAGLYEAATIAASTSGFCRVTATMPADSLGKSYELTVNAASTTSSAQVILTEGFVWGSSEKVQRLFRKHFAGDNEYDEYKLRFKVEKLPFYLNFGIMPDKKGEIRIAWLELKEIAENQLDTAEARNEFPRDMNRYEMLTYALKRYKEAQPKVPAEFRLPAPAITIANNEESLKNADAQLGELEKILVIGNPAKLKAAGGVLRLQLLNRHAPHSVWARLELAKDVEYRIVAPDGKKYLLNQADLVSLPAGQVVTVEISHITTGGQLKIYPLDHFASNCWNIIEVEL